MSAIDLAEKLVKEFEGCALKSYQDIGGVWTIGWGCVHVVFPNMTITQDQANERLQRDLEDTMNRVKAQVDVPLNDNQLAALISFTYNEGAGHLHESTLLAKLNESQFQEAADAFLLWDKCRGATVPGLLRRRQAERGLFLSAM